MLNAKKDIIRQLQQEINQLQGLGKLTGTDRPDIPLGPLLDSFPDRQFPMGVVHEFISQIPVDASSSAAFVAGLSGHLMRKGGACLWISSHRLVHPTGLTGYNIQPDQVIFVDCSSDKQVAWATEEALRTEGLAAVITECRQVDFTASRRWQLAAEKSHVTGFLLRHQPRSLGSNACMARWRVRPLPADPSSIDMPGLDFPRWQIELLRVKNGRPAKCELEWVACQFRAISDEKFIQLPHTRRKAV